MYNSINNFHFHGLIYSRLVSGAGDIKITKDGNTLLHEMVCISIFVFFLY
jgi:hypothetical protein